ncbi:hypothetical protein CBR_g8086 [Chara braunii]|uniref:SMP-30/Gluconolactonase/LRE-like region domain-containing protein n=1 Tax=Chara braunii TaxID=69332 RepID=A0A388KL73_CHABU|nr:hypothetical protein CBR_g8086 [Chara braunii]|eukprot:GBG70787.1 hypothetical protein CBR_g8086 [Chara braunii]
MVTLIFALLPLMITCSVLWSSSSSSGQPARLPRGILHLSVPPSPPPHGPDDSECRVTQQQRRQLETQTPMGGVTIQIRDPNVLTVKAQYAVGFDPPENVLSDGIQELALSPKDKTLFVLIDNTVLRMSTDDMSANATLFAGLNRTFGYSLALEDRDLEGTGTTAGAGASSDTWPKRVLHVGEGADMLHAFSIDRTGQSIITRQLYSLNYSGLTGDLRVESMAIDARRRMLYASTGPALYRANLTSTPGGGAGGYTPLEHWLGVKGYNFSTDDYVDSDDPREVRLGHATLDASAISPDGETIFFADRINGVIRRLRTSTGAVDSLTGVKTGQIDGAALESSFLVPRRLAVSQDGCHVFVFEGYDAGRLRLITLNSSWGEAVSETTIADLDTVLPSREMPQHFPLAISPESDVLYIAFSGQIVELVINRSALRSCLAPSNEKSASAMSQPMSAVPPPVSSSPTTVRIIVMASAGLLLLLVALSVLFFVVLPRRSRRFERRRGAVRLNSPAHDREGIHGSAEVGKAPKILGGGGGGGGGGKEGGERAGDQIGGVGGLPERGLGGGGG